MEETICVERSVKPERCRDGGNDLPDKSVEVGVGGPLNVEVPPADVVDGLVVDHEGAVRVLQSGVGRQDGVVRLDDSSGNLWCWIDRELQFGPLAVVDRQPLHQQGGEPGPGPSSKGVKDEEPL